MLESEAFSQDSRRFAFALGPTTQNRHVEMQPPTEIEESDFISGIDSRGNVLGGKKKVKQHLVIPMPAGWTAQYKSYEYKKLAQKIRDGEPLEETPTPTASVSADDNVQTEPEIIEDCSMDIDEEAYNYIMSLPPLLRNRPPGLDKIEDEKDRFLFDVNSRPNEANLDAYDRMPLEKYGEAMLRGMGWKEGMPIGKNATHVVPVIQFIKQPPRVGLGAVPKVQEVKRPEGWIPKPGESRDPPPVYALPKDKDGRVRHWKTIDEKLKPVKEPFSAGSNVFITGGPHRGLSAKTAMKQGENVVVILPSDERVIINTKDLKEVGEDEPILLSSSSKSSKKDRKSHKSKHKHKKDKKKKDKSSKKHKKRKRSQSESSSDSEPPKKTPAPPLEPRWITTDIRVKICSKTISEGRYYCKCAWIIDVLPENRCVLRVEDSGIILENIRQEDLETVVPATGNVKVVRGEYSGEFATVYEKIPDKQEVYVQLEDNLEICKLSYDDVSQVRT